MPLATSLSNSSQIVMALAAVTLVATLIWRFTTKGDKGDQHKRNLITGALLVVIVSTVAVTIYPAIFRKNKPSSAAEKGNAENSDIEKTGGTIFTCKVYPMRDETGELIPVTQTAIQQVIQTIEKRLNNLGTADLLIVARGSDRILVQLPGITPEEAAQVRKTLEKTAKLELKAVHPDSRALADTLAAEKEEDRVLPPGYKLYVLEDEDEDGQLIRENILLKRRSSLDGSYIVHAQELYGPHEGKLTVKLNGDGANKMFELTKRMRHGVDRLAIVLDGKVLSAPVVQDSLGANFEISGMKNAAEAKAIAAALYNPLILPLEIIEERTVSAEMALKSAETP